MKHEPLMCKGCFWSDVCPSKEEECEFFLPESGEYDDGEMIEHRRAEFMREWNEYILYAEYGEVVDPWQES